MSEDTITVWRNEFDAYIEQGGEECLSAEKTVQMAIELENKLRNFAQQ